MEIKSKGGQVWVETVIYTLIGLALIGLVLAIATPKINDLRDRSIIEQTVESLNILDSKVNEALSSPGNVRIVEFKMRRGSLVINPQNDYILYELSDSRSLYSEPGIPIQIGRINVTTTEGAKRHKITLLLDYSSYNLLSNNKTEEVKLTQASVPYKFVIENRGFQPGVVGKTIIDIKAE